MQKNNLDQIVVGAALCGLLIIAFTLGIAASYYDFGPAKTIHDGIESGELLIEKLQEPDVDISAPQAKSGEPILDNKIYWNKELAYEGYTLITHFYSTTAYLVDMNGRVAYRWDLPFDKLWPNPSHTHAALAKARPYLQRAHVFPNGDLLVIYHAYGDTPYGYGMAKVDKRGNVLWTYGDNIHHDFHIDETNGHIYTLSQSVINKPIDGLEFLKYPLLADYAIELSADGKELNRISILEAFRDSPFSLMLYQKNQDWDYFHTNTINKLEPSIADKFPMFKPGQLLISARNYNIVAVLDPATRHIVWAYNGLWKAQHDPRFLPNGNILLIDNLGHAFKGKTYSRVLEFNPSTLGVEWSYLGGPRQSFYTTHIGRAQRLPNGNTLFIEATNARALEVTHEGKLVWSIKLPQIKEPFSNAILTAYRYTPDQLPFLAQENRP